MIAPNRPFIGLHFQPMFSALRVSRLISLLLLLALVGIATYWVGQLFAPKVAIAPSSAGAPSEASAPNTWTAQLFGSKPQTSAPLASAASNQPSNLQLQGLITGAKATAVISIDGKPAKAFELGQEVQAGQRLVEISAQKIVLEQNGVRSELKAPAKSSPAVLTFKPGNDPQSKDAAKPPVSVATPAFGASAQTLNPAQSIPQATPQPTPIAGQETPATQASQATLSPTTRLRGPPREPMPGAPTGQPANN